MKDRDTGKFSHDEKQKEKRTNLFTCFLRDPCGTCHLLKVEVVQQGPTFFIVFADADVMPPPFRIDNCTDVSHMKHFHRLSVYIYKDLCQLTGASQFSSTYVKNLHICEHYLKHGKKACGQLFH